MTSSLNSSQLKTMKLGLDFFGQEFLGDRSGQEDYSLFRTFNGSTEIIAVLADGMGGHASGEVASKLSVETFNKTFSAHSSGSIPVKLGAALQQANSELSNAIQKNAELDGMGCTIVGTFFSKEGLQWISVGDSPLFLYRSGRLKRLNADHSMIPLIQESLRSGKITKEEASAHPNRHALRSAVMGGELTLVDASSSPFPLFCKDIVILASDGLLTLSESQIEKALKRVRTENAEVIANSLIDAVKEQRIPRQDNTSVQVVIIPDFMASKRSIISMFRLPILITSILAIFCVLGYYIYHHPEVRSGFSELMVGSSSKDQVKPTPVPTLEPLGAKDTSQGLEGVRPSPIEPSPTEIKKDAQKIEIKKSKGAIPNTGLKGGGVKPLPNSSKESLETPAPDVNTKTDEKQNKKPDASSEGGPGMI